MRSEVRSGIDWFELHGIVDFGDGLIVALPRLLEAVRQGRRPITLDDGTTGMVPEEWLRRFAGIVGVGEDDRRSRPLQAVAGGAARRGARRAAGGQRRRAVRSRRDELASFGGIAPLDACDVLRRAASRLPARRARLVRLPAQASASAAAWPTTWGSARPSWCWPGSIGCAPTSRGEGRRRWSSSRARSSSTGSTRPRASRRSCACSTSAAPGRSVDRVERPRHRPDHLRHAAARRAAAEGRRVRLRDPRRGAGDQEREHGGGQGRAAAPREASAGAERHADREPSRRAVEPVRVPESRPARHVIGVRAPRRRGRAAAIREALDVLSRGVRPFILRRTKAQVAPELPPRTRADDPLRAGGRAARALRRAARSLSRGAARAASQRDGHAEVEDARARGAAAPAPGGLPSRPGRQAPIGDGRRRSSTRCCRSSREVREEGHKALVFSQFTSLLALLRDAARRGRRRLRVPRRQDARSARRR